MIMRPGQQLLLPANPWFILLSLIAALALNMLLNMGWLGRAGWTPDLLAVTLVFWTVHQPRRVGVVLAFTMGLAMDVHQGAVLGQHALAYTVLSYLAIAIHRRLLWFSVWSQTLQVLPLFAVAHGLDAGVRLMVASDTANWDVVFAPLLEAFLWPLANVLLLAPQRRAPDPDADRPL